MKGWSLAGAATLFASAAIAGDAAPGTLPAGPGQAQVQTACAGCHALTIVTGQKYDAKQWGTVVDTMVDRGAVVPENDYDAVVAYLAKNFGPAKK